MVNINGLPEINGENYPLDIWSLYMQGAVQDLPVEQLDTPSADLKLRIKTTGRALDAPGTTPPGRTAPRTTSPETTAAEPPPMQQPLLLYEQTPPPQGPPLEQQTPEQPPVYGQPSPQQVYPQPVPQQAPW